jgi:amidase
LTPFYLTLLQLHGKVRAYKDQFLAAWNETAVNSRPIDALICPPAPGVGYPHDFNTYWGYTALFNLVDYPSVILPIKGFNVTPELDPVDVNYQPSDTNPYDRANHEICRWIRGSLVNFANKSF